MDDIWRSIWLDANTQWVLASTILLGISSGIIGCFALLKKQSLVSDAVAHAALPGICFAYMFTGEKNFIYLMVGASLTGLIAAYFIQIIVRMSRIKEDSAITLILSVFFGLGIVLLTKITSSSGGNKSGLDDFIFGQAAALIGRDVKIMSLIALLIIFIVLLFYKEFKLTIFDSQFSRGIGLPYKGLQLLLTILLVTVVVIGMQAVGVILMAALLIIPPISARYWTDSLTYMIILSSLFGAISGAVGTIISTIKTGLPTGPFIVVVASSIFLLSFMMSPKNGLFFNAYRRWKIHQNVLKGKILMTLYERFERSNNDYSYMHLNSTDFSVSKRTFNKAIKSLLAEKTITGKNECYQFTQKGMELAFQLLLVQRAYEVAVMHEAEIGAIDFKQVEYTMKHSMKSPLREQLVHLLKTHHLLPKHPFRKGVNSNEL